MNPNSKRPYEIPAYTTTVLRERDVTVESPLRESRQAAPLLRDFIADPGREVFVAILLDARNRPIGIHTVSVGTLTSSLVHPREALKAAVIVGAAGTIFGHNHPSGDASPSREDVELTRRLCEAGKILGIRVLDHVIVGDGTANYYSFADEQELPPP